MNLLLLLIVLLGFYVGDFKKTIICAFVFGLINDLIAANIIGISSLIYLIIIFLLYLYRNRFSTTHILFQLIFILASDRLYSFILNTSWTIKKSALYLAISLIIIFIINRIKGGSKEITVE
jgi:rod shape-determining protein MreD